MMPAYPPIRAKLSSSRQNGILNRLASVRSHHLRFAASLPLGCRFDSYTVHTIKDLRLTAGKLQ
jgi:hypothetical protein